MPVTSRTIAAIDSIFADWNKPGSPGMAVGVVREGETVHTRGFGLANVEHGVPVTTSTIFDIASMTKQFTAFAILMLVGNGKLNLDDEVREFVPELPAYEPPIRVRHCLYHTTGLTDWIEALEFTGPPYDYYSSRRAFRTITALEETMFPAGHEHSYSNTGYVLLAWIVARVAGKPLPEFLKEHVFGPLGMSSSAFLSDPEGFLPNQAQGYCKEGNGHLRRVSWPCNVYGDGGMLTSIDDMIRWLQNFNVRKVGDPELFDLIFAPGHLDDGQVIPYSAGWELECYRGLHAIRHGGMGAGFQSHIAWLPEVSIGVAILGNVRPCWPWPLADKVIEVCLGERIARHRPTIQREISYAEEHSACNDISGRYFTATGFPILVDWNGDHPVIDVWFWRRSLSKHSVDVFREDEFGETFTFHRNAEGKVTHFTTETDDGACARLHSPLRTAVKFENVALDLAELALFDGRYINNELDTVYTIVAAEGELTAKHMRCFDWHLRPIKSCATDNFEDDFAAEAAWPGKVTFERNLDGDVVGFRVRGTRVNLYFRKFSPAPCTRSRQDD